MWQEVITRCDRCYIVWHYYKVRRNKGRYVNFDLVHPKTENLVLHNARFKCEVFNFENLKALALCGVSKKMSLICMYDLQYCHYWAKVKYLKLSDLYCDHAFVIWNVYVIVHIKSQDVYVRKHLKDECDDAGENFWKMPNMHWAYLFFKKYKMFQLSL